MAAERFEIAPCSFIHGAAQTLNLSQMAGFTINSNGQQVRVRPGGSIDSLAQLLSRAKPTISFRTMDIATVFGAVSATLGLKMTGNSIFRLLERTDCGAFETTGVTVTAAAGCMYPTQVQASNDGDGAELGLEFVPLYDGTNPILVSAASVDLSGAPSAAFNSQFFLGPVYHNSSEIRGVRDITVDFGLQFVASPNSPGPYDRKGAFNNREPVLRFTTEKIDEQGSSSLFIRGVTSSFAIYLQKGSANSDRVAAATAQHVKISCTAGSIETEEIGGDAPEDALTRWTVRPTGTIALSIASAIP